MEIFFTEGFAAFSGAAAAAAAAAAIAAFKCFPTLDQNTKMLAMIVAGYSHFIQSFAPLKTPTKAQVQGCLSRTSPL